MLHPSVTSYQCFRGRKKYHTIARKILSFPLFFHPQKNHILKHQYQTGLIPQRARFTAFQQTVTSSDTLGIHIPFLSKLFISVTCYDHLIHNSHSCKKIPSTSRHTTLLVTQHCATLFIIYVNLCLSLTLLWLSPCQTSSKTCGLIICSLLKTTTQQAQDLPQRHPLQRHFYCGKQLLTDVEQLYYSPKYHMCEARSVFSASGCDGNNEI